MKFYFHMSTSAIAVITYNRLPVIQTSLEGLLRYSPGIPLAIFEDGGYLDDTRHVLTKDLDQGSITPFEREIEARAWQSKDSAYTVFLGNRNLGVAGNSNRAIHWFMTQTDADHLCLCNDDILPKGDFVNIYQKAHEKLGVGLLCLMPFDNSKSYVPSFVNYRGTKIKLCPRLTGIMMSITRECLNDVGYFDMTFKKFGEEHVDFNHRARFMGHISLDDEPHGQIDIVQDCVSYQDVGTSVSGSERATADAEAAEAFRQVTSRYRYEGCYRPFAIERPRFVGAHSGVGIPYSLLEPTHAFVSDWVPFLF